MPVTDPSSVASLTSSRRADRGIRRRNGRPHWGDVANRRAVARRQAPDGYDLTVPFSLAGGPNHPPRFRHVVPSDQPVMYATAMLRLRKDHGGDAWVKRYFAALAGCPEVKADTEAGALRQAMNWVVAASAAA